MAWGCSEGRFDGAWGSEKVVVFGDEGVMSGEEMEVCLCRLYDDSGWSKCVAGAVWMAMYCSGSVGRRRARGRGLELTEAGGEEMAAEERRLDDFDDDGVCACIFAVLWIRSDVDEYASISSIEEKVLNLLGGREFRPVLGLGRLLE